MKITIDSELVINAQRLGSFKTKKAAVEAALQLFVAMEAQKKLKELHGKIEFFD